MSPDPNILFANSVYQIPYITNQNYTQITGSQLTFYKRTNFVLDVLFKDLYGNLIDSLLPTTNQTQFNSYLTFKNSSNLTQTLTCLQAFTPGKMHIYLSEPDNLFFRASNLSNSFYTLTINYTSGCATAPKTFAVSVLSNNPYEQPSGAGVLDPTLTTFNVKDYY